jgi:voltage-gated potassium channel Kch
VNNPEVLERLGIARARIMVFAISDPMATRRAVATARRANPGLFILVRTRYVADVDDLISLGADAVIRRSSRLPWRSSPASCRSTTYRTTWYGRRRR